ncbi:MAG: hypothetical protein FWE62_01230 [Firmicutes bacterium]|nr:hypothetical protein [Bacillota bacterium]
MIKKVFIIILIVFLLSGAAGCYNSTVNKSYKDAPIVIKYGLISDSAYGYGYSIYIEADAAQFDTAAKDKTTADLKQFLAESLAGYSGFKDFDYARGEKQTGYPPWALYPDASVLLAQKKFIKWADKSGTATWIITVSDDDEADRIWVHQELLSTDRLSYKEIRDNFRAENWLSKKGALYERYTIPEENPLAGFFSKAGADEKTELGYKEFFEAFPQVPYEGYIDRAVVTYSLIYMQYYHTVGADNAYRSINGRGGEWVFDKNNEPTHVSIQFWYPLTRNWILLTIPVTALLSGLAFLLFKLKKPNKPKHAGGGTQGGAGGTQGGETDPVFGADAGGKTDSVFGEDA